MLLIINNIIVAVVVPTYNDTRVIVTVCGFTR